MLRLEPYVPVVDSCGSESPNEIQSMLLFGIITVFYSVVVTGFCSGGAMIKKSDCGTLCIFQRKGVRLV